MKVAVPGLVGHGGACRLVNAVEDVAVIVEDWAYEVDAEALAGLEVRVTLLVVALAADGRAPHVAVVALPRVFAEKRSLPLSVCVPLSYTRQTTTTTPRPRQHTRVNWLCFYRSAVFVHNRAGGS